MLWCGLVNEIEVENCSKKKKKKVLQCDWYKGGRDKAEKMNIDELCY